MNLQKRGLRRVELINVYVGVQELGSHRITDIKGHDGLEIEFARLGTLPVDLKHRPTSLPVLFEELFVLCQCGDLDCGCEGPIGNTIMNG